MEERKVNLPDEYVARMIESITNAVPETESIYIFGSYARGEETPDSDVDIYVVTSKDLNKIDYEAMTEIRLSLMWMHMSRDVICLSTPEFKNRASRPYGLERVVQKEGVRIYG